MLVMMLRGGGGGGRKDDSTYRQLTTELWRRGGRKRRGGVRRGEKQKKRWATEKGRKQVDKEEKNVMGAENGWVSTPRGAIYVALINQLTELVGWIRHFVVSLWARKHDRGLLREMYPMEINKMVGYFASWSPAMSITLTQIFITASWCQTTEFTANNYTQNLI